MRKRRGGLRVTDERGAPEVERVVVRLAVTTDAELLPTVVDFVRQIAQQLGLKDKAAEKLDQAVETVCRNVIEHAFNPDEAGQYDIEILRRPGRVVIAVEDRGLPFDYARFQDSKDRVLPEMLHRSFADEIRFVNLGRGGNRVELVKHLPRADVREHLSEDEHREVSEAPAAPEELPLEIRPMRPAGGPRPPRRGRRRS